MISITFYVTLITLLLDIFRNISHFEKNRSAGGARFNDFIKVCKIFAIVLMNCFCETF